MTGRRRSAFLAGHPEAELRISIDFAIALRQALTTDFYFVQIGAFDGETDDPLAAWIGPCGWRGLLVEPQPRYFEELVELHGRKEGLQFRRVAAGTRRETRTLWTVAGPDLPKWAGMLASFDRDVILSHQHLLPGLERMLKGEPVECVPLDDLLEQTGEGKIDLLQIDVEGYDHELIRALDLDRFAPAIIHFEHRHLGDEDLDACLERLVDHGYSVAMEAADTLAYRVQESALATHSAPSGGSLEHLSSQAAAHAVQVAELERRLAAAEQWTEEVAREAARFRQRSLDEQKTFLDKLLEEALGRAEAAEKRLAELEAGRDRPSS